MLGHPRYKNGDIVQFLILFTDEQDPIIKEGTIAITNYYGVFEDNSDVHYDIYNKEENTLYKHCRETCIIKKIGEEDPPF